MIVITPSSGPGGRREGRGDLRRRPKTGCIKGWCRSSGRGSSTASMEGTRARRAVPSRATERRAWGGAVGSRGRSAQRRSCSGAFTGDEPPAQRGAFEVDAMSAMDDAVENGVGEGGIADHLMPSIDRDLAGDQQRTRSQRSSTISSRSRRCSPLSGSGPQSSMINRRVRSTALINRGNRPSPRAWARSMNRREARF